MAEFSLEHIFPERLGGALCNEVFRTRNACRPCNSTLGLFADGAFIKSWFSKNDFALASQEYIDPRIPSTTSPLFYMGILTDLTLPEDEVCEMWLGPCGVHFYHIHRRDDSRWDTFAGGNPIDRKSDPGRVYVLLTTAQQDWVSLNLRSALDYFPQARRYGVNIEIRTEPGAVEFLIPMDEVARAEAERIRALDQQKKQGIPLNLGFDQRFMPKLALGLGSNLFGQAFLDKDYTRRLRGAMWERDIQKRAVFGLRGVNFLNENKDITSEFMGWKGAFTIRIMPVESELVLTLHFPSSRALHLVMANEPELWLDPHFAPDHFGLIFLILPQIKRFVGPISLLSYISHRSQNILLKELQELEALRVDRATLPPCR